MNKRMTYLLTTLLIAQSLSPVYAQTSYPQKGDRLALNNTYQTTTGPSIGVDTPTTTGPSIGVDTPTKPSVDVNNPTVAVQVTADSITTGGSLYVSDFKDNYVTIKVNLQGTSFKNPRDGALIVSTIDQTINIRSINSEDSWKLISSLYVNSATEFVLNIKTEYLDMDSLSNTLSLRLPERLLTTDKDVTVEIPLIHNVKPSNGSAVITSEPVLVEDILGGRFRIAARLENTAFKNPKDIATSVHSYILSTLNLRTKDGTKNLSGPTSLAIISETEFAFELQAANIDPNSIQDMLTFTLPGHLLTKGKNVVVQAPVVRDKISKPESNNIADNSNNIVGNTTGNTVDKNNGTVGNTAGNTVDKNNGTVDSTTGNTVDKNNGTVDSTTGNTVDKNNGTVDSTTGNTVDKNNGTVDNSTSTTVDKNSDVVDNNSNDVLETAEINQKAQQTTLNTNTSAQENKVPVTVSNSVEKLIQKQKRNLLSKAQEVNYGLKINNKEVELENKLLISNGRTLAPIRTISEALNISIDYHAESKTAIIQTEDTLIELPLGYNVAIVNDKVVQLDANDHNVSSTIKNNRSYLPMKFIAEQLDLNIDFNGEQVNITSTK